MKNVKVSLVAAVSKNGVIGVKGQLPWNLPEDLKRFKEITYGAPVIMGRKTFDSIGRLLPGRKNIIVSRNSARLVPGAWSAGSLTEAFEMAEGASEIFVIGGGEIYRLALPVADRIYLTEVDVEIEGDAFFPGWPELKNGPIELDGVKISFQESEREERPADLSEGRASFCFYVFDRKS